MTEHSYLNPNDIKAQSKSATHNLEKDNDAIAIAEKSIIDFYDDKEIKGDAFDTLKQQLGDYIIVLQALRSANDSDIADFNTLINSVGNITLDGEAILNGKKEASDDTNKYCNLMEDYERKARNCNVLECLIGMPNYYLGKAASYSYLVQQSNDIYNEYKAKEEKYDEIENATKGLFTASTDTRLVARNALRSMKKTFVNGKYVPDMSAKWRTDIFDCYYERIFTENEDGTIVINMEEVKKNTKQRCRGYHFARV